MRLVFIHGGLQPGRRCWDDTIAAIKQMRPDIPTDAVNLPGRLGLSAGLSALSIDECAAAVVRQIHDCGGRGR